MVVWIHKPANETHGEKGGKINPSVDHYEDGSRMGAVGVHARSGFYWVSVAL